MKFLFLFLFPLAAFAQSVPNGTITQGEVWTPAQWNYAWQSKQDYPIPSGGVPFSALPSISPNTVLGSVAGGAPGALNNAVVVNADRTGVADAAPTVLAAVTAACAASPVQAVYFPPGTYQFNSVTAVPAACNVLTIYAIPGSVTIRKGTTNSSNPAWAFNASGQNKLRFSGIIFDGNYANDTLASSASHILEFTAPMDDLVIDNNQFINNAGSAIYANPQTTGVVSVTSPAALNATSLTVSTVPATIQPGGYIVGSQVDADIYVTVTATNTLTLSKGLTDVVKTGTNNINVTPGFTITVDIPAGATTLTANSTSLLSIGQTIWPSNLLPCMTQGTKITNIVGSVVTFDNPTTCFISSNSGTTLFAALAGFHRPRFLYNKFDGIGLYNQSLHVTTSGSSGAGLPYTVNGTQSNGATTLTMNCNTASCGTGIGVVPPFTTAASGLPAGVPANDTVINQSNINTGAGTYQITLANPLTGTLSDGTYIPFLVQGGFNGYAVWMGQTPPLAHAPWATFDVQFVHNQLHNIWTSPFSVWGTGGTLFEGNTYDLGFNLYQNASIGPSACVNLGANIGLKFIGEDCSGSTGRGIESNHSIGLSVTGSNYHHNATSGIFACSGRDVSIGGATILKDNGQIVARPIIQTQSQQTLQQSGLLLSGSCSGAFNTGSISNISLDGLVMEDDQATPTQQYGVDYMVSTGTVSQLSLGAYSGSGNVTALADPNLLTFLPSTPHVIQVLCQSGTAATHTGDTAETRLAGCTVPPLGANDALRVTAYWQRCTTVGPCANANTDSMTYYARLSSAQGTSGVAYMQVTNAVSGVIGLQYVTYIRNLNATNSQQGFQGALGVLTGTETSYITGALDTTATSYVNFNCKNTTSSSDTCGIIGYEVERIVP